MSIVIVGATIIDGVADRALEGRAIWIERGRIKAIAARDEIGIPAGAEVIDARGKFIMPGLMNANVHLLCDVRLENLARYAGCYEELIAEAAQVALKNGVTTVFDTWGPRRFLMSVRDRINAGELPGSRIFCAGNIIGFDGPYSQDNFARITEVAGGVSGAFARRINAIWVENSGRHLMWLTPQQVAKEVSDYIGKGIDFVKYAANEHFGTSAGAFLVFSQDTQKLIVAEAHAAGITAQAHTTSVEGLRTAVVAGCNLIQHANITGPTPIPESTLEMMAERRTGAVIFPWTQRGFEWLMNNVGREAERTNWQASDINARNFIRSGVPMLMANDGALFAPEVRTDALMSKSWGAVPSEDSLVPLDTGHFVWLKAMEEKGCAPMEMLRAATRNVAVAYGKDRDLGTLESGKIADLLILNQNPLTSAAHYRCIHSIIKDGEAVDLDALPLQPLLTRVQEEAPEEEAAFVPFVTSGSGTFPLCPCARH